MCCLQVVLAAGANNKSGGVYLVIRRLSKKLGEPWRLGIDGDRDLYALLELDDDDEFELERLLSDPDRDPEAELSLLDEEEFLHIKIQFSITRICLFMMELITTESCLISKVNERKYNNKWAWIVSIYFWAIS